MILAYCDGSVTGGAWGKKIGPKEPIRCWFGWVVRHPDGTVIHHYSFAMGECPTGSGNLAEYGAVSSVLRWLAQNGFRDHVIEVRSDSQLIVNQLSGKYNCHDDRLRKLRDHVREIAALFPRVTYVWIPREENRYADAMSKALQNGGTLPPVPLPNMT